jgi:hypothetical protein
MKWISVKERKPKNKENILISCEYGVTMAEYTTFENGNELWWAVTHIGCYDDGAEANKVTHWMPLPEKPII